MRSLPTPVLLVVWAALCVACAGDRGQRGQEPAAGDHESAAPAPTAAEQEPEGQPEEEPEEEPAAMAEASSQREGPAASTRAETPAGEPRASRSAPSRQPALFGKVLLATSGGSNRPLPKAEVVLWRGERELATAYSDAQGNYAFWKVPPGRYRLTVAVGNEPAELLVDGDALPKIDVALAEKGERRDLLVRLVPRQMRR